MATKAGTKERLEAAAMHAVNRRGRRAASVRSITRAAGVTEGALYRHYKSKDALLAAVYDRVVAGMIEEKRALVEGRGPMRERLRDWIRLTYRSFDADPDGFAFVFLSDAGAVPRRPGGIPPRAQSGLFTELVRKGQASSELRPLVPELAAAHFTALMLNVPRLIRAGTLAGPAAKYVEEIAGAAWCVLGRAGRPKGQSRGRPAGPRG